MPALHGLTLSQHDHAFATTITLAGELDLATGPLVRAALEDCLRREIRTVDIDLADLTFCDASGLDVFLAAADHTAAAGGLLRLHHPQRIVARVLDLTGTRFLLHSPQPSSAIGQSFVNRRAQVLSAQCCGLPGSGRRRVGREVVAGDQ